MSKKIAIFIVLILWQNLLGQATWEERRQIWLNSAPDPADVPNDRDKVDYLSAWLELGKSGTEIDAAVQFLVDWHRGQRVQWTLWSLYPIKYGSQYGNSALSSANETKLKSEVTSWLIGSSRLMQPIQGNKQFWGCVGVILYTRAFDQSITFNAYGHDGDPTGENIAALQKAWKSFSYGGRTWNWGDANPNAYQVCRDWLEHKIDSWVVMTTSYFQPKGPREYFSMHYSRAYIGALIMLYEGLRILGVDADLQNKAKLAAEVLLLHHGMSYAANNLGGTIGRSNWSKIDNSWAFPAYVYTGVGPRVTEIGVEDLFLSTFQPNDLIVKAITMSGYGNNDWDMTQENWSPESRMHLDNKGKWIYRTKFFSLGGNYQGGRNNGWQAVIKGANDNKWIRLWVNDRDDVVDPDSEGSYLGNQLRQFRNAAFAPNAGGFYHEVKVGTSWDEDFTSNGWQFKRLGNVFFALGISGQNAGLQIEIQGVNYASFNAFQTAVIANASLTGNGFTMADGTTTIDATDHFGINSPGDQSFPSARIRTVKNGSQTLVSYNEAANEYTITVDGQSYQIDVDDWTSGGGGGGSDPPILVDQGDVTKNAGDLVVINISATDDNSIPSLTISGIVGQDEPASTYFIDNGNGTAKFSWQTDAFDIGNFNLTVTARDIDNQTDTDSFVLTIAALQSNKKRVILNVISK